jgi:hypothetical protein
MRIRPYRHRLCGPRTVASGLLMSGPAAQAQSVEPGSPGFTSGPGDCTGGGRPYAHSTGPGGSFDVWGSTDDRVVSLPVFGASGGWWYPGLAAPSGQALAPGGYTGATRYPFNSPAQPGLSLAGNGRGCNQLNGSFTASEAAFGTSWPRTRSATIRIVLLDSGSRAWWTAG